MAVEIKDWELLRVLLETARAGSLRKAESVLGITQPTIGKKIDRLEQMVNAKVFYRTKAGMALTLVGETLFHLAEEMERTAEKVQPNLHGAKMGLTGHLRIAVTDGVAGYWLPHRLRRFHREHPNVLLDVQCIDANVEVDLSKREADLSVMYTYPTDSDVVVLQKSEMVLVPVCTKGFIEEHGRPKNLEDVLNFPVCAHHMHYRKTGPMRPWAEMLERHTMVIYRTASSMVLGQVTKMGIGMSLQPIGVMDREDDAVMLDLDGFRSYLPFYLVCHRDTKDVPVIRSLIQYFKNSLFKDDGAGSPAKSADPSAERSLVA